MLVVSVRLLDLPVIVTVEVPAAAELATANVTTLLPDVPALKVAVTPLGRPDADNVAAPVKPDISLMVMLLAPLDPGVTLKLAGVAASVKPGRGLTVSAIVALLLKVPEVPVIVTVDVPAAAVLAEGEQISGWQFLKTGLVVMPGALLFSVIAVSLLSK
jgi:hypothetical protein